jgi:hypothetical protein
MTIDVNKFIMENNRWGIAGRRWMDGCGTTIFDECSEQLPKLVESLAWRNINFLCGVPY